LRGESMSGFQTKTQIKALLEGGGRHPRKRYGQHFLIDRNLMEKLVDAAEITGNDCVLEVGTGTGSLTGMLAERAGQVISMEIDEHTWSIAREQVGALANVSLILGDALQTKSELSESLRQAIMHRRDQDSALKLVANLPYDIATALIINLLLSDMPLERMCFTVQAEVADRFMAKVGSPDYGPISILTAVLTKGRRICRVPPTAFWPEPKVDSAMLRLDKSPGKDWSSSEWREFARLVRHFFQKRRKTLGSIAKDGHWPKFTEAAAKTGAELSLRPERVDTGQWLALFAEIQAVAPRE
jgi:16S rRNA (adenine1518-N6/adenine1519-N6)-dimethyltransferase